jgi:tetratricopeptide (TPR) repeat protein
MGQRSDRSGDAPSGGTRIPIRVVALVALVGLAGAAAWGTSRLLPRADPAAPWAIDLPDLPPAPQLSAALAEALATADRTLREALADEPDAAGPAAGRLGQLYQANNFVDRATRCYQLAITRDAAEPRWPYLLASLHRSRGDSRLEIELLQRAVDLAPDYAPAWLRLGDARFTEGLPEQARAGYERRLALVDGDPYAHLGLARLALDADAWEAAEHHLTLAGVGDGFETVYRLLASVHEHFGRETQRRAALARADRSRPFAPAPDPWVDELMDQSFDVDALLLRVSRWSEAGRTVLAQRAFERARQLEPENPEVYVLVGRYAPDVRQARQAFETAVSLAPDHAVAHVGLGEMLLREDRPAEAEVVLRRAIELDPDQAAGHKNLGLAAAAAGRFDEAVRHVRRSMTLSPNTVSFHYSLASILRQAGRPADARDELRLLLERWPTHPGATQALAALEAEGETDR